MDKRCHYTHIYYNDRYEKKIGMTDLDQSRLQKYLGVHSKYFGGYY
jgi:hypothetical protein